ncbi:MAG: ribonuclease Y, partial [Candidatus Woesebacteria bacterium]|nr:ribonuclease Y [Candidatus Woesebacteria bacterium]
MDQIIIYVILGAVSLIFGSVLGYYVRQNLAKRRAGSLEAKLQKRVIDVKEETSAMVKSAEKKSSEILEKTQKDI